MIHGNFYESRRGNLNGDKSDKQGEQFLLAKKPNHATTDIKSQDLEAF